MMTNDKDNTPVGKNVFTMCTKCKLELEHVVLYHNEEGTIEKVKCFTCGSEHKYRPDKKKSPGKTARAKAGSRKIKKVDPARDFDKLTEKLKDKNSKKYTMSGSFNVDDVIDHHTFGTGFVISTSYLKMEVVFADKPRLLVCNR